MFFLPFILGFLVSYIGSISPSMLNLSAVKISIENTKKEAYYFSWGISFVVIFQTFIALYFLKILINNSVILAILQKGATIIFAALSFYFFKEARKKQSNISVKKTSENKFFSGVFLSVINLFSIPFYVGVSLFFTKYEWMNFTLSSIVLFALGSFLGTYVILYHYILFADKIKSTITKVSHYFNYILSGITGLVAVISLIKML